MLDRTIYASPSVLQVGFCRAMLLLGLDEDQEGDDEDEEGMLQTTRVTRSRCSNPRVFFLRDCGFDQQLWEELEYVISDM